MEDLASQLTLVTVSYNSVEVLGPHIQSLLDTAKTPLPRWIVVDNASVDGSVELLISYTGVVELLQSPGNIGFGAACNLGIAAATTRYVVVMNPDTELSEKAFKSLLYELKRYSAAIAGPSLSSKTENKIEKVAWLVGAVLLLDKTLMDEVGYFDEQFFLYEEDVDLCKRANDNGLAVIRCNNVSIPHVGGGSTRRTKSVDYFINYHKGRSYALFVKKHFEGSQLLRRYALKNWRRLIFALVTFGFGRYGRARAKLKGVASVKF
ncbi:MULTISPECIES: glycosyltransferase family 2 protein [Spongiibacter]|uniref:glycosyltransferase family 2 protein n=1 Tax=Spongiibacter TaxID=630749 RepID=UPI000C3DBD43|nr:MULTISPECIES: glycosyltransferase family 2 protein [Spongiibacter]MAY39912.1 hypothetical protein [Spongiibacter sp.]MBI58053.1 hypothetical protein [Spongiibacter sp.]|tara:strand:- start:50 stop:841 length:792 start_codon:yes stop_codon:yes gene_type:complete